MGYSHDERTPLIIHEKMAGNRDAQSQDQKDQSKLKYLNKTPPGLLLVGRHPLFWTNHGLMFVGGGGV